MRRISTWCDFNILFFFYGLRAIAGKDASNAEGHLFRKDSKQFFIKGKENCTIFLQEIRKY